MLGFLGALAACASSSSGRPASGTAGDSDGGGAAGAGQPSRETSGSDAGVQPGTGAHAAGPHDAGSLHTTGGAPAPKADAAIGGSPSRADAGSADSGVEPSADTSDNAADLAFDAFNALFYTVNAGKGYYLNNSGAAAADHWWTQAELIEVALDAYTRKPSDAYRTIVTELVYGFVDKQRSDWSYNEFNDDIAWMVIASARAHLATGNADFLKYAQTNWDKMYARAWEKDFASGGLWWKTDKKSKNACVNGPGAIGAYLLYKASGDPSYLAKAIEIYQWLRGALFDAKTGAVYDNLQVGGGGDRWTFTYNSGTFIGIANYLFKETGKASYFDDAKLAANFFMRELSDKDGLIAENAITGDGAAFKAIGFRWLALFMTDNHLEPTYLAWLQSNANRAWANRRADNIAWNDWRKPTPHMLLESTGAAATVQILQVVPPGGAPVSWSNSTPQDGRRNVEAESCDEKRGMVIEASEANSPQLGGVSSGSWARYGNVDFSQTAPTSFVARAAVDSAAGGVIEIHVDSLTGPLIGTCRVTSTGSWTEYAESSASLAPITGAHDVYLSFKPATGGAFVANLNWFRLR